MALGVPEFRRALVKLGDALDSDVVKLVGALATQDTAGALALITDAYPELVTPYLAAAGDLSATWYEDQAPDVDFLAEPAELPSIEQLAANGRYALTTSKPASVLSGAAKRQLFKTHRDTILENAEREGVTWVREARPGACGFCRMLATRVLTEGFGGAPGLYLSEDTANATPHTEDAEGHDHCRCVSVPIRAGQPYRVPAYVSGWLDDYEAVSRDDDGRLLPVWKIADEMEKRGAQRGNPVEPPAGGPATAAIVALDEKRPATSSTRAPDGSPLALTAAPVRLAIEARKAITAPAPGDVADWLAANDQNWAALEAFRALDEAIADGTASQPIAPAKGKRAKSRPFAEVEAERRAAADVAIDEAVAAFEAACATGDDEQIAATCDAMEALEAAEQERRDRADAQLAKIAEKHERQRQRRDAERLAIQDEIAAVAEANEAESDADYWQAEAEVMARRTGKSTSEVLTSIRKREFVRASSFKGNGFEDTLKNEFAHLVEQAYMQAEDATNGVMIRKGSKFDSKQLWYCNDATARRHMSEEMAAWFDEHGRLTLPVLREMVLSGENFANLTVMNQDYLQ